MRVYDGFKKGYLTSKNSKKKNKLICLHLMLYCVN